MNITDINARGMVLLGCGKMGSALLAGWLRDATDTNVCFVKPGKRNLKKVRKTAVISAINY